MGRVPRWTVQAIVWTVIVLVTATLAAAVLVPRLAGGTPYSVLTGSMQPEYPPGTLVVVRPIDVDDIVAGDVITYQLESGEAPVVTHRVVSIGTSLAGEQRLTTQGDANEVADAEPVLPVQVRGKVWYSVPYLGHVNNALSGGQRQAAVYMVAGGLLIYAAWMFAGALHGRRQTAAVHKE